MKEICPNFAPSYSRNHEVNFGMQIHLIIDPIRGVVGWGQGEEVKDDSFLFCRGGEVDVKDDMQLLIFHLCLSQ